MPKAQPGQRHYMRFEPERKFIAINSNNTVYTELSADDLSQCKVYSARYYCSELVEYKMSRQSCLSALYLNRPIDIASLCPAFLSSHSSDVMRLSDKKWLILADADIHFRCTFQNGTKKAYQKSCEPG